MADGRLGEAFVEFALRCGVLVRVFDFSTFECLNTKALEAFDGDHLGLGFQQNSADLSSHLWVPPPGAASCPFSVLGDSVVSSFAVTRIGRHVSLVIPFSVATPCAASVVRSMSGADSQVVLRASVCVENVLRFLHVQSCEGVRRLQRQGSLRVLMTG